jgi:hypothetical protein
VLVFVAGCSKGPSAQQWAGSVCAALGPWRATITDLNRRAADQMAQAKTPAETKQNLVALVADARDATEKARAAVAAAGVPNVQGGASIASSFADTLARTRDAYAAAETELQALAGDEQSAFYDGVVAVLDRLNQSYQASGVELTNLDSPQLREAFDRLPECR